MLTKIINNSNTILIQVHFIDACNYSCYYCYNKLPRNFKKINIDILEKYLINIYKQYHKNIELLIIGGEPTLHPNLLDFCKNILKYEYITTSCFTNFSANADLYLKLLEYKVKLLLSWHYLNKDFFNKLDNNFEYFKKYQYQQITLLLLYEPEYTKYIIEQFKKYSKIYTNVELVKLILNSNKYLENDIKLFNNIILQTNDKFVNCVLDYKNTKTLSFTEVTNLMLNRNFYKWLCFAGIECQYIHSDGNIYICQTAYQQNSQPIGNMYNIKQIFQKHPKICPYNFCCDIEINKEKIFK